MVDEIQNATLRVRGLEFDPQSRLLVVQGHETLLDRRSATVLLALLDRKGHRVGKDELLRLAWPKQVVHENSLAKAISRLRRLMRGSGLEITASYGYGYTLRETAVPTGDEVGPLTANDCASAPVVGIQAKSSTLRTGAMCAALLAFSVGFYALAQPGASYAIRDTPPILHDAPDAVATVLWVDDHPSNNRLEIEYLKEHRVAVHQAETTEDALKLAAMNSYRLVISDLGRGEDRLAGLKMVRHMKEREIDVPVLIYTVRPTDPSRQKVQRHLVAEAGASGLAVTPQQVRAEILGRL